ncbi:MAG: hypothetical protein R6V20_08155 [Desulfobia sp.]
MDNRTIEKYRRFHKARLQSRKDELEQRRQFLLSQADKITAVLQGLGATRIILYGSVLRPERFHDRSDLDIIAYGLSFSAWHKGMQRLEEIPELADVTIDLKCAEEVSSDFLDWVEEQGRELLREWAGSVRAE